MQDDGAAKGPAELLVVGLDNTTDVRGFSFSLLVDQLGCIGPVQDMHIAEIVPGAIRGNHYHAQRGEIISVIYRDSWSLHWDEGEGTSQRSRSFTGSGAVAVIPPKNWSHAVRNDGQESMVIVAVSDKPYDRHAKDEIERDAIMRIVAG